MSRGPCSPSRPGARCGRAAAPTWPSRRIAAVRPKPRDNLEREAIALLRSIGARPLLARTLMERASRRDDEAALGEARAIYAELGATAWLARADEARGLAA